MLLTESFYRAITSDTASAPEAFATAASSAQDLLEDALDRVGQLEQAERTETLELGPGGWLWPTCTPVISASDGWQVIDNGLRGGSIDLGSFVALLGTELPTDVTVTYVGGWTAATLPGYARHDLAWVTFALLHPPDTATLTAVPAGANAASVGDVSVSWGAGGNPGTAAVIAAVSWSPETLKLRGTPPP